MDKFHKHRLDCPFSFAPLDVCDCVEKNLRDRIEADAKRIAELARERDNWSETALMHLNAEQTFLSWLREAGEHMRSEGVTICDDGTESGEVLSAKVPMCAALLKSRAEAAEAHILSAIDTTDLDAHIGAVLEEAAVVAEREGGWRDHHMAHHISRAIRALRPDALQALERVRREARVEALKQAADAVDRIGPRVTGDAIRALIADALEGEK